MTDSLQSATMIENNPSPNYLFESSIQTPDNHSNSDCIDDINDDVTALQSVSLLSESNEAVTKVSFCSNPTSVKLILLNELCERFSYYGYRAILSLYLASKLGDEDRAVLVFSYFSAFAYITPLLGGHISDAHWGRYRTIIVFSLIYLIGSIILTLGASSTVNPDDHLWFVFVALTLTSLGTGGIKPCVSSFGADQINLTNDREGVVTQSFFYMFYFTMNIGSTFATIIIPTVRTQVSYSAAFAIPAALLFVSIMVLVVGDWCGVFVKVPPATNGGALAQLWTIFSLAYRRKTQMSRQFSVEGKTVDARTFVEFYARSHPPSPTTCACTSDGRDDGLTGMNNADIPLSAQIISEAQTIHTSHHVNQGPHSQPTHKVDMATHVYMDDSHLTRDSGKGCCSRTPMLDASHTVTIPRYGCSCACNGRCQCGCGCGDPEALTQPSSSSSSSSSSGYTHLSQLVPWLDLAMPLYAPLDHIPSTFPRRQPVSYHDVANYADTFPTSGPAPIDGYSCSEISDVRRLLSIVPVFAVLPVFWCLMNQQGSTWMLQAQEMDLHVGILKVEPEQMSVLNPIFLFIILPVFEFVFRKLSATTTTTTTTPDNNTTTSNTMEVDVNSLSSEHTQPPPVSEKSMWLSSSLAKMFLGMLCACVAYICAGFVELHITSSPPNSVSIGWQVPQYFFVTVAEVLISVTGLQFAFQSAPASMKSLVTALLMLSSAVGDIITGVFYSVFVAMGLARWGMFFAFAGCVVVNSLFLLLIKAKFGKLNQL